MKDDLFCVLFEEDLGDDFNDTDEISLQANPRAAVLTSDEELQRRELFFSTIVPEYKKRVKNALGPRHARELEKFLHNRSDRLNNDCPSFTLYQAVLYEMYRQFCIVTVEAKIRYTPKKYRKEWTASELDRIVDICGIENMDRIRFYKVAGVPFAETAKAR